MDAKIRRFASSQTDPTPSTDRPRINGLAGLVGAAFMVAATGCGRTSLLQEADRPDPQDQTQRAPRALQTLAGVYENHLYDGAGKNDWHFVTIVDMGAGRYTWSNQAGVSWTLTATDDPNVFAVGPECPYFEDGHREAVVERDDRGTILLILGPWGEPYDRTPDS